MADGEFLEVVFFAFEYDVSADERMKEGRERNERRRVMANALEMAGVLVVSCSEEETRTDGVGRGGGKEEGRMEIRQE